MYINLSSGQYVLIDISWWDEKNYSFHSEEVTHLTFIAAVKGLDIMSDM